MKALKPQIKEDVKKQFLDIKTQTQGEQLYVFILGRVEDIEGQYFPVAATVSQLKERFAEDSEYYSTFWFGSEMTTGSDIQSVSYEDLCVYLEGATDEEYDNLRIEYDTMLIESLKELRLEGFFNNEISEFAVFIQYADDGFDLDESSYETINGNKFLSAFQKRYEKCADSLTEILLKK